MEQPDYTATTSGTVKYAIKTTTKSKKTLSLQTKRTKQRLEKASKTVPKGIKRTLRAAKDDEEKYLLRTWKEQQPTTFPCGHGVDLKDIDVIYLPASIVTKASCKLKFEIRHVNETVGLGLHSLSEINKGVFVGEYTGEFCSEGGQYVAGIHPKIIDAEHVGNEFRFVNDFRGLAKSSNVELRLQPTSFGFDRLLLYATKKIGVGEQLLLNYGVTYWKAIQGKLRMVEKYRGRKSNLKEKDEMQILRQSDANSVHKTPTGTSTPRKRRRAALKEMNVSASPDRKSIKVERKSVKSSRALNLQPSENEIELSSAKSNTIEELSPYRPTTPSYIPFESPPQSPICSPVEMSPKNSPHLRIDLLDSGCLSDLNNSVMSHTGATTPSRVNSPRKQAKITRYYRTGYNRSDMDDSKKCFLLD
eukprot:m.97362 g.97362  ORF g.97362 m.97362 type:complete len:417 (-) comp13591_c0_seq1:120-1370(-)